MVPKIILGQTHKSRLTSVESSGCCDTLGPITKAAEQVVQPTYLKRLGTMMVEVGLHGPLTIKRRGSASSASLKISDMDFCGLHIDVDALSDLIIQPVLDQRYRLT
jgi:hypothetical protein